LNSSGGAPAALFMRARGHPCDEEEEEVFWH
jgi:hypothetical protein